MGFWGRNCERKKILGSVGEWGNVLTGFKGVKKKKATARR